MKKELQITALKEGTVIDHIPARLVFRVLRVLNPQESENTLIVATNLASKRIGKKGMIKIDGRELTQIEVNKISILAPKATVNIIKNYDVKEKINIEIPDKFLGIVKCTNPNCITNMESVTTNFIVKHKEPLKIKCQHCERSFDQDEIEINKQIKV